MKCSVDGCYAKTFHKNMCRNHWYMWVDQLAAAPGTTERGPSERTPAPTSRPRTRDLPYIGPCRCESPRPYKIPWFGCFECLNCGMPLAVPA